MTQYAANILAQRQKKPLIWVIDDVLEQQEGLLALLEMAGFRTEGFVSHRLAADKLGGAFEMPTAIFCDYETENDYSADWFMEQLKESGWYKKTKVIGISGANDFNKRLITLGADSYIDSAEFSNIIFDNSISTGIEKIRGYIGMRGRELN